jgi:hypothetical protein
MKPKRNEIKGREGCAEWGLQTVLDLPRLLRSQDTGTCSRCIRPLERCSCREVRAVLCRSRGQRQYACADWPVPRDLSRVSTIERHHRVRDHLERPRRKRGERRSELRATIGRGIGMPTPFASEHHGDDHLEPLQATAAASMAAVATVLRARAVG